jgi:hypothetical protein
MENSTPSPETRRKEPSANIGQRRKATDFSATGSFLESSEKYALKNKKRGAQPLPNPKKNIYL